MVTKWHYNHIVAIIFVGLLLRLVWAALVEVDPVSDSYIYHVFAQEIALGNGYRFPSGEPTVYWPVGPAVLYGLGYYLFGVHGYVVVLINLILSMLLILGVYRVTSSNFGVCVGEISAAIIAMWPVWIEFTTVLNSELPFVTFLIFAIWIFEFPNLPRKTILILSAALVIGAAYMRPIALPLLFILPFVKKNDRNLIDYFWDFVVVLLVASILVAPWVLRNKKYFDAPVLISANFGANLWMGNHHGSDGGYVPLPDVGIKNEVMRDKYFKEKALEFILDNPREYIILGLKRVKKSFDRESIGVVWNEKSIGENVKIPLKILSSAYWIAVCFMAFVGVVIYLIKKPIRIFSLFVLLPGFFSMIAILVVGQDRYHMPLAPFIAMFAAYAVWRSVVFIDKKI